MINSFLFPILTGSGHFKTYAVVSSENFETIIHIFSKHWSTFLLPAVAVKNNIVQIILFHTFLIWIYARIIFSLIRCTKLLGSAIFPWVKTKNFITCINEVRFHWLRTGVKVAVSTCGFAFRTKDVLTVN